MGESGSVAWMFKRVSIIEGHREGKFDPEEEAIEAGADEVENHDNEYTFYGAAENLDEIRKGLQGRKWTVTKAEMGFKATNITEINDEQRKEVEEFLAELDELDDSHRVYATLG